MTTRSISRSALLISASVAWSCGASAPPPAPVSQPIVSSEEAPGAGDGVDLVIINALVRTMDPELPTAEALAIDDGKFVAVGLASEVKQLIGRGTKTIDMHGGEVTPGLIDAHAHLYGLGRDLEAVDLRGASSEADAVARVVGSQGTDWLIGRGWDQTLWSNTAFPTKASLDAALRDRPVILERIDGHAAWVSSRALADAGITAATKDPAGGKIVRDAKGEPTGVLLDNAIQLVSAKLPAATEQQRERRILAAAQIAVGAGLTAVHDMNIEDATAAAYQKLAAANALPLRVSAYLGGDPAKLDRLATPPQPAVGRFVMSGVKFFADGALGSRGARLYKPYSDDRKNSGLWATEPKLLATAIDKAFAGGWQVAVHAIGDAAIGATLDAFAAAEKAHPGEQRPRIEHVQIIAPADIAKMVATHAIASMQPVHATSDRRWAEARVGKQRLAGAYAWRTMLDKGIPLAAGSDFPYDELSPLAGIYAAVTREGWTPAQKITLDEAIRAYTTGAAFAEGAEATRGMIAVGRAADLTAFDAPLAADRSLLDRRVVVTVVDGDVVYDPEGNAN